MKIAIFGLGSIGQRHARNLAEMGEADILGCDPRVGTEGFITEGWVQAVSAADLVWQWKPDIVLVCTPPESHFELCRDALSANAHVFCEKPLAIDLKGAEWLTAFAKEKNCKLAVGYQLRWQLEMLRFNDSDDSDLVWECSQDMRTWPSQYEKDVLLEFSHEIDAAVFTRGAVKEVVAEEEPFGWTIKLRHFNSMTMIYINYLSPTYSRTCTQNNPAVTRWEFDETWNVQAYKSEIAAFLSVCRGEPWHPNLCTGAQAAHVVTIIEACKESASHCKVVEL